MTQPTSMTRFLATPRVSAALYVGCAVAVLGWFEGAVPWWLGLIALCFVGTVRKAVNDVRRYNQWSAAWAAMGGIAAAPDGVTAKGRRLCNCGHPECTDAVAGAAKARGRKRKASSSRWTGVIAAALLLFPIIPSFAVSATNQAMRNALTLLWLATAVYLVCKVIVNRRPRRSSVKAAPASPAPAKANTADIVEWMLPPAASSPSRADATRQLPDYCARLLAAE